MFSDRILLFDVPLYKARLSLRDYNRIFHMDIGTIQKTVLLKLYFNENSFLFNEKRITLPFWSIIVSNYIRSLVFYSSNPHSPNITVMFLCCSLQYNLIYADQPRPSHFLWMYVSASPKTMLLWGNIIKTKISCQLRKRFHKVRM